MTEKLTGARQTLFNVESRKGTSATDSKRAATSLPAGLPAAQGLYDPRNEHDACGIGFVANIHNRKSHKIIEDGLQILENLEHRGAVGADPKAGDGAGILIQMPDAFFRAEAKALGFELPPEGHYGVGQFFLPRDAQDRAKVAALVEKLVAEEGQIFLGWRDVPVDNSDLGYSVKPTEPFHCQAFVGQGPSITSQDHLERKLFVIRKRIFNTLYAEEAVIPRGLYISSFSSRTIVYKGMLLAAQVGLYYKDLKDPRMVTALAMVHQRFSTNTFPTWSLAHPFRMISHNGEINTVRGNTNWIQARYAAMQSDILATI